MAKRTLISAQSPKWSNEAKTTIDLDAEFAELGGGSVPFTCSADADTDYGRDIFARAVAGEFGAVADYAPIDRPVVVPFAVSRFQARAALHVAGLLDDVEAAVAAAPDPLVQIAWADAQSFERSSPTIATLAAAIGLNDTQVDDLFIAAAKIRA